MDWKQSPVSGGSGYPPGTIVSGGGQPVLFDAMIQDLSAAQVVYVGETHTRSRDHEIQLRILKALHRKHPDLAVGMEMFSQPYQTVLDEWKNQKLTESEFIQRSHWYANWKYDFDLYAPLLAYIREQQIPIYALNIEFHIPSRVAAGGLDSLLAGDRKHLPDSVFLEDADHREYVRSIFDKHGRARRQYLFEHFYQAHCVWEDTMAEAVSRHIKKGPLLVFAGNGHITHQFGIPKRTFTRSQAPFRTVMPVAADAETDADAADYLWITAANPESFP